MPNWKLISLVVVAISCLGAPCGGGKPVSIVIDSPSHGDFLLGAAVQVDGRMINVTDQSLWAVTVNGAPVAMQPDGSFSISTPLDTAGVFTPILAQADHLGGPVRRDRIVVHAGESRADGAYSEESVALRLDDQGLDSLENVVSDLVDLDIASLLPPGTTVINNFCAIDSIFGCLGRVDVQIVNPPASFSSFGLDVDSMTVFAAGDVLINNVEVFARIIGSGIAPSCNMTLRANTVSIIGDYELEPGAVDPTAIDVNLLGSPGVSFTAFQNEFTSGLCDFPLIGDLIQLIIGDIEPTVVNGMRDFLSDPDGSGPADAPIAEGIETALADISIAGPIGQSLGAILETPLFSVDEDNDGITLGSDSSFVADCTPPAGAPDLSASYHVDEAFPTFGPLTPGGSPFGMGMCVSTSAFNQLLKAQTECGLLLTTLTRLNLGGGSFPILSDLLALFIPEFAAFPPGTLFRIELVPTLAPIVTGEPGPSGELAELKLAHLVTQIIQEGNDAVALGVAVDARLGLEMTFDDLTGSLVFQLTPPLAGDVVAVVTEDRVGIEDLEGLETVVLPGVLAEVLPSLASSLGEFPLPTFLNLELQGVEVSAQGEFMSLFADLVPPAP
jgi:hypothetical protein